MITLTEYVQADRWVDTLDEATATAAEGYTLGYDQKSNKTVIRLFDKDEKMIGEGKFDSSEMAIALLEEYFDISDEDRQWNESLDWVKDSIQIDEALDPIETFIEKNASDYNIRIDSIDPDAQFDDIFGIEVFFNRKNNRNDLDAFVKEVGYELLRTYGIQSYDYDGQSWKLAL